MTQRRQVKVLSELTLSAVQAEAVRAHLKHREHGGSILDPAMSSLRKLAALGEEYGEVCKELTYDQAPSKMQLVTELIQVAAVALTWVQCLEGQDEVDFDV
jgi:hypothetical protein